ncbi:MAG: alpha/beta fold hydrolase [Rubrivivax sp.]|nr:alpha/beta fold hydrolase [Rubrivivax sp.]
MPGRAVASLLAFAAGTACGGPGTASAQTPGEPLLQPCRLEGHAHEAACGKVLRPLDPGAAEGRQIEVHFAVLPALARNKHPDPVFVFPGGPGQSAIDLAGHWARLLARLNNRRDIVLVDQRGTGRSARLACPELPPTTPLADTLPQAAQLRRLTACREALQRLPHGDLRHYTTWVAVRDVEAVRLALGAAAVNLFGASYGTRVALEFMRQFPRAVRRAVLDGVAPPDMTLPAAFDADNEAALAKVFAACEAEPACRRRYPALRERWRLLLAALPRTAAVVHPVSGRAETLELTGEVVRGLVRGPLYAPALAAALPAAIEAAVGGRFEPMLGLASALQGARTGMLAEGMHYSVLCAEDVPRRADSGSAGAPRAAAGATAAAGANAVRRPAAVAGADAVGGAGADAVGGADAESDLAATYRRICAGWPRGEVPPAFYSVPPAPAPVLVFSGGADPATPPRHGERLVRSLGPRARQAVVAEAGHGVTALPCVRDVLFRFIDAADEAAAAQVDAGCAAAVPRPPVYEPLEEVAAQRVSGVAGRGASGARQ